MIYPQGIRLRSDNGRTYIADKHGALRRFVEFAGPDGQAIPMGVKKMNKAQRKAAKRANRRS